MQPSALSNAPEMQAAFMRRHELPVETLDAAELEELKPELIQVLNSLNLREVAADVARGPATDMYYKVHKHAPQGFSHKE